SGGAQMKSPFTVVLAGFVLTAGIEARLSAGDVELNKKALSTTPQTAPSRKWDTTFLSSLSGANAGDSIGFELNEGRNASGTIRHVEKTSTDVVFVSGELEEPEPGRFFFQKQQVHGVAGEFVGVIEFPASETAYRIEPTGPNREPELVQRKLGDVLCLKL